MTRQLYIGKKDQGDLGEEIGVWVDEKIPPPPPGLSCECGNGAGCHDEEYTDTECKRTATTYLYYIKGDRACYTYVCEACCEANLGEPDYDYPTTKGGYAVVPTRCIQQEA